MRFAIVNDLRIAQEILRHAIAQIPGATVAWWQSTDEMLFKNAKQISLIWS